MGIAMGLFLSPELMMVVVKEKLCLLKMIEQVVPLTMTATKLGLLLLPMKMAAKERLLVLKMKQAAPVLMMTMMRLYFPLQLLLMVVGLMESGCCWVQPRFQWQY